MGTPEPKPTSAAGLPATIGMEPGSGSDAGGDAACWLDRVCPACGGLDQGEPTARCTRCGYDLLGEDAPEGSA